MSSQDSRSVWWPILARRSAVAFAPDPVDPAELEALLEAARWAPSSFNEQPWRLIVCRRGQGTGHEALLSCLSDTNRSWAHRAPVLILFAAVTHYARNGRLNAYHFHDTGLVLGNLLTAATALGLATHPFAGFDKACAAERLDLPEGIVPVTAVAVGHPGDASVLTDKERERETRARSRRPLSETVFGESFGKSLSLSPETGDATE